MHKYIIVRVFSHKTKEMTLSPMTETKSPNSALECFPKFSQKCRACVKIFLVGWEFISPKYMILYVNIVVLFTGCDFIDELPLKKGNMLCKIQPGSGLFTNLSILHCIDFLPQWKKNKQTKHLWKKKIRMTRSHELFDLFPPFLASKSSVSCSSQNVPLCRSFNWFVIQFLVYVSFLIFEKHRKVYWHDNNEVGWRSLVVVEQVNISLWINRRVNIEPKTISMLLENVYAISVY